MSRIGLVWNEFPERGPFWFPSSEVVTIGRSSQCQLAIPKERRDVSRVHVRLVWESGRWYLWDQSTAGTQIDGVRVPPGTPVPLTDGGRLTIGPYSFKLLLRGAGDECPDDTFDTCGEFTVSQYDPAELDTSHILDSAVELPTRLAAAEGEPAVLKFACSYLVGALRPVIASAYVVQMTGDPAADPQIIAQYHRDLGPEMPAPAISRRIIQRALHDPDSAVFLTRPHSDTPLDATVVAGANLVGACSLDAGPGDRPMLLYVLGEHTHARDAGLAAKCLALVATLTGQRLLTMRRARMAKYFSPRVLDLLMRSDANDEALGPPRMVEATAFFLDLRGFSRSVDAAASLPGLEERLTGIITRVTEIIFEFQGTIIDYQGDAVFAAWGVPVPQPDQASLAARCALEVVRQLAELDLDPLRPQHPARASICGIGLCSGPVLAGTVGSRKLFKYGLLGPAINIAKRVEELTKRAALDATIVCCAGLAQEFSGLGFRTRRLARVRLAGMPRVEDVYELVDPGSPAERSWSVAHDQSWDAALSRLESVRTGSNLAPLVSLIGSLPADHPRTRWLRRTARQLRGRSFLARWEGVIDHGE